MTGADLSPERRRAILEGAIELCGDAELAVLELRIGRAPSHVARASEKAWTTFAGLLELAGEPVDDDEHDPDPHRAARVLGGTGQPWNGYGSAAEALLLLVQELRLALGQLRLARPDPGGLIDISADDEDEPKWGAPVGFGDPDVALAGVEVAVQRLTAGLGPIRSGLERDLACAPRDVPPPDTIAGRMRAVMRGKGWLTWVQVSDLVDEEFGEPHEPSAIGRVGRDLVDDGKVERRGERGPYRWVGD